MHLVLPFLISFAARTFLLTLLLWIMVKLQKLNYFFLGLLGSAALASALDLIPYFGHYLAVPVLYLCIWKVTQASLVPDAMFTVAVSYALMFAVNVMLLTALLPPIHPLAAENEDQPPAPEPAKTAPPAHHFAAPSPTNKVALAPTNKAAPAMGARKSADDWLKEMKFKGVTENGDKSTLLLLAKAHLYSLPLNEMTTVTTVSGSCQMRLIRVSDNWATVEVNGEEAYFALH